MVMYEWVLYLSLLMIVRMGLARPEINERVSLVDILFLKTPSIAYNSMLCIRWTIISYLEQR